MNDFARLTITYVAWYEVNLAERNRDSSEDYEKTQPTLFVATASQQQRILLRQNSSECRSRPRS